MHIEVVIGPMFAGKSSYILAAVKRNQCIGLKTFIVKPKIDNRYSEKSEIVTHNNETIPCICVGSLVNDIGLKSIAKSTLIIVEEAQFFPDLLEFVYLMENFFPTKQLMIVGLDGDSNRRPFGRILDIIPLADKITKLKSVCGECKNGTSALFSFRKERSVDQIHIGGAEEYVPLCRFHFIQAQSGSTDSAGVIMR